MEDLKRSILLEVKAGRLSPEQAAERLESLSDRPGPIPGETPDAEDVPIRRIRVVGDFRTCKISGDASVAGAVAEGEHVARREGDILVIDARVGSHSDDGDFTFTKGGRDAPRVIIGFGPSRKPVSVRMNPDLPLEIGIDAGSASIAGVRSPIEAHIDAGSIKIEGCAAPVNLSADAGSISVTGVLDRGESRIRTDAGSVRVRLLRGSSVRVRARTDIGKITLGNTGEPARGLRIGSTEREEVFGGGTGELHISTSVGKIAVEEA